MKPSEIKVQLKKLAKEFDLKFNSKWFDFIWMTKRQARYLEYVGMCFDPIYTRFGKTIEKRIKNIDTFENSRELKEIEHRFSGQAITKDEVMKGITALKNIKNHVLRKELLKTYQKIKSKLNENSLALLTIPDNDKEKDFLLNSILLHEWIHVLLIKNKIYFQSISENYWKYDEGLVTYLEYFLSGNLNSLKPLRKNTKYLSFRVYFIYALKFRKLLENVDEASERKAVLLKVIKELNHKED